MNLISETEDFVIANNAALTMYHRPGGSNATLWELMAGFRSELAFARTIDDSVLKSCQEQLKRVATTAGTANDFKYDIKIGRFMFDVKSCSETIPLPGLLFSKDKKIDISDVIYVLVQPIPGQNPFLNDAFHVTYLGWCPGNRLKRPSKEKLEGLKLKSGRVGYWCPNNELNRTIGLFEKLRQAC